MRAEILPLGEGALGAAHGLRQALLAEGLEQVIESVDFEGADGVLVVGRDKDDGRRVFQCLNHAKAIQPWHLDVQQYQVWQLGFDHLHGLDAIPGLADDLYLFEVDQVALEPLPRRGLVVHDQGSDGHPFTSLSPSRLAWALAGSPGR